MHSLERNHLFTANPDANGIARTIVEICCDEASSAVRTFNPIGIILTGSFSRGEGSVLRLSAERSLVLGDAEFLIIFPDTQSLKPVRAALETASREAETKLSLEGILCPVDFSPACKSYLKRVPPSIFGTELKLYGQVMWGESTLLELLPELRPDSIPKIDAFFLLCNRMVEQIGLWRKIEKKEYKIGIEDFYCILKLYLDLAGSLLIFMDRYQSSYRKRIEVLEKLHSENGLPEGVNPDLLLRCAKMALALKFEPSVEKMSSFFSCDAKGWLQKHVLLENMKQAGRLLNHVLLWEGGRLIDGDQQTPEAGVLPELMKTLPLRERVKMWLKWIRIAAMKDRPLPVMPALRGIPNGNPRMMLYLSAFYLYNYIWEDAKEKSSLSLRQSMEYLPLGNHDLEDPEETADVVVDTWQTFVRNA